MCRIDDYPGTEFCAKSSPIAQKPHQCCECLAKIEPGEKYFRVFGVWDGYPDAFKTCQHCEEGPVALLLQTCGGFLYGQVFEELLEHYHEGGDWKAGRLAVQMRRRWRAANSPLPGEGS